MQCTWSQRIHHYPLSSSQTVNRHPNFCKTDFGERTNKRCCVRSAEIGGIKMAAFSDDEMEVAEPLSLSDADDDIQEEPKDDKVGFFKRSCGSHVDIDYERW